MPHPHELAFDGCISTGFVLVLAQALGAPEWVQIGLGTVFFVCFCAVVVIAWQQGGRDSEEP